MSKEGQYFSDAINGNKSGKGWRKNQYDAGGAPDLFAHDDKLHDQNESESGERIDQGTGKPIDNSTYTGLEGLSEVDATQMLDESEDVLPPVIEKFDAAAAWLAEHDVKVDEVEENPQQLDVNTAA